MTTQFPTALDALTNPSADDALDAVTVPHATQHANANDAIEALQAKVGIDSSANTSSLDYRVATLETGKEASGTAAAAVAAHAGEANPHPGYLTPAEGDAAYDAAGTAAAAVAAHEAALDPHAQYLTAAEGAAAFSELGHDHAGTYEPAGTVATHEAAVNPHPGYLTPAEGDAAYSALGHNHTGTYEPADANLVKKNAANVFTATQTPDNGTAAVAAGGTHTFDGSAQVQEVTLTGAGVITFGAPSGIVQHSMYKFILRAGDTSARTFAFNAAFKFPAATSPLTSGTATSAAADLISFIGGASNTLIYDGHSADVR